MPHETEMKKKPVDDALHATRITVEEGIVPGGGYPDQAAKPETMKDLGMRKDGVEILMKALERPPARLPRALARKALWSWKN